MAACAGAPLWATSCSRSRVSITRVCHWQDGTGPFRVRVIEEETVAWVLLAGAIIFEVFGTVMLKVSDGFTRVLPAVGVVAGYILSFGLLGLALRHIGLSTAYAIWAGVGTVGVAVVGVVAFGENLPWLGVVGIALVVAGVVLLNFAVPH